MLAAKPNSSPSTKPLDQHVFRQVAATAVGIVVDPDIAGFEGVSAEFLPTPSRP